MRPVDDISPGDAQWLADALECAGIEAATEVDEKLIGDLSAWKPMGILNVPGVKVWPDGR